MIKKILSIVMCVCLLMGLAAFSVSAAALPTIEAEIPVVVRICPGTTVEDKLDAPEVTGNIYSQGWEIKFVGGDWIPYDGEALDKYDDGCQLRYFAANAVGEYVYSNECVVTMAHNPQGSYKYSGTDHWRECADCGGQADKGGHTHLGADATSAANICQVCGHKRTSQYTGILAFWEWIMALIGSLLG